MERSRSRLATWGWDVTGVDVRSKRMPDTDGVQWVESDVRDFDVSGYDCISNLGLLYHLELSAQLDLLRRCAGTPMILDTHATRSVDAHESGYEGTYFDELAGRSEAEWQHSGTASWGNRASFWPTEESLHRMLTDCGFRHIWTLTPWYLSDRTFWFCI